MNFCIKVLEGKNQGEEYLLTEGENLVGRSRSAHVRVYNEDVSGKHFILEIKGNTAIVHNISAYGTRIDGTEVHKDAEIHPGQVITAGRTLKLLFSEFKDDEPDAVTGTSGNEITSVTKFVADTELAAKKTDDEQDSEATAVTKIQQEPDEEEKTSVTRVTDEADVNQTQETRFVVEKDVNQTQETRFVVEMADRTVIEDNGVQKNASGSADSTAFETTQYDPGAETVIEDKTVIEENTGENTFSGSTDSQQQNSTVQMPASPDPMEEHGAFYEEETQDAEKTNADETQCAQTRVVSLEEMKIIKDQMKKQQQSKLFFKFLIISFALVMLAIIWMMKMPQQEAQASWPHTGEAQNEKYLTDYCEAWDGGFEKGSFDLYYPQWAQNQVERNENTICVHTFLGKKQDVPLEIIFEREASVEHVYENHEEALENVLKRLSESMEVNFEIVPAEFYFTPSNGPAENGIPYNIVKYQRDHTSEAQNSGETARFGILRFFRSGQYNYIVRAEVPASEKNRALSVLQNDAFLIFHSNFVRNHWEGSNEYRPGRDMNKEDISDTLMSIRTVLNKDNKMEYQQLEHKIKRTLARTRYNNQKDEYIIAMGLLRELRQCQQQWYNGAALLWANAVADGDQMKKTCIREDGTAIFSKGDKRRYDILRDYWE